ncbi:hypothetical protein BJV82DRAFT_607325 [Fennellomyces sp. T-0311]|nr:hypothetical protein BJV82DRAFT_607325 [Fennellomyces sp. T-0311]
MGPDDPVPSRGWSCQYRACSREAKSGSCMSFNKASTLNRTLTESRSHVHNQSITTAVAVNHLPTRLTIQMQLHNHCDRLATMPSDCQISLHNGRS